MALSMSLSRATISSLLITKFRLSLNLHPISSTSKDNANKQDHRLNHTHVVKSNPFLVEGPKESCTWIMEDDEALYGRIDMPGIGKEGLKVVLEKDELRIKGMEGPKDPDFYTEDEEEARQFLYKFVIPRGICKTDQIKVLVQNGVVRVVVPKSKVST